MLITLLVINIILIIAIIVLFVYVIRLKKSISTIESILINKVNIDDMYEAIDNNVFDLGEEKDLSDLDIMVDNINMILIEDINRSPVEVYKLSRSIYNQVVFEIDTKFSEEFKNNFEYLVCDAMVISYKKVLDIDYNFEDLLEEIKLEKEKLDIGDNKFVN